MQNWEALKEEINKMNKDEFIIFVRDYLPCSGVQKIMKTEGLLCGMCKYELDRTLKCKERMLEDKYQPLKQENG